MNAVLRFVRRLALAALPAACLIQAVPQPRPQPIASSSLRVGMWTLWHDRQLNLIPAAPQTRIALKTCAQCAALSFAQPVVLRAQGNAVVLTGAGKTCVAARVSISGAVTLSAHGESVTLHHPFAISAHNGVLVIAVSLPVEDYVERVVASESGPADSLESLKALAIVVRTFALHQPHGHADFDLCDSTHCQLLHWGANPGRAAAAHAAALATAGETLRFHGSRALAYFAKDCGGRTAAPAEIWPRSQSLPYLRSQPDPYCARTGGSQWASRIARADLVAALAAHGLAQPGWRHLTVVRRSESGRAEAIQLDAQQISAEDFRIAVGESLGWDRVPSTWFEVSEQGGVFLFHGRGWGHGVGLCQKGAAAMAADGRTSQQILAQYFPGAQAADEATGRPWQSFTAAGLTLQSLDSADAAFLPALAQARAQASQRSGLNSAQPIAMRAYPTTAAYRDATLAPGWVAALYDSDLIAAQPLRTLAARHLLDSVMRHEFLHALVERQSGPAAPLWLREGVVEALSDSSGKSVSIRLAAPQPTLTIAALDAALAHASTLQESEAAHRAAGWYAARLLDRYGRESVLNWLRSGLPAGIVAALGQR